MISSKMEAHTTNFRLYAYHWTPWNIAKSYEDIKQEKHKDLFHLEPIHQNSFPNFWNLKPTLHIL